MVKLLGERVVYDADERYHLMGESEGDGDVGKGMDEIGGAIDWIDDEGRIWA